MGSPGFPHPKAVEKLEDLERQLQQCRATLDELLSIEPAAAVLTRLRPDLSLMALSVLGFRMRLQHQHPALTHPRQEQLQLTPPEAEPTPADLDAIVERKVVEAFKQAMPQIVKQLLHETVRAVADCALQVDAQSTAPADCHADIVMRALARALNDWADKVEVNLG